MRNTIGWAYLLCIVVACASAAPVARAQDSAHDAEAHAYFEAGRMAFGDGRYDEALAAFQRAFDLSQRGQLLYNIGQCHDRMRHDHEALDAFERFLAAEPDSPQAAEVRARVAFLERAIESEPTATSAETSPALDAALADTTVTEPAPAPSSNADVGPAPWILVGVGGVLVIAGAVLVGLGFSDVSTVQNAPDGARYATVHDADQQATPFIGAGFAGLGIGAALAAVGIVWAVTGAGAGEHAALHLGPNGIELRGTF